MHSIGAVFVPLEKKCSIDKYLSTAEKCGASLIVTWTDGEFGSFKSITYSHLRSITEDCRDEIFHLPSSDDVSEILFSTGTTGKEKGIVLTHRNSVASAENIVYGSGMMSDNVELIPSPLNHSHGLRSLYANLIAGATVVLSDGVINIKKLFSLIDQYGVNSIDLVPAALTIILKLSGNKIGEYKERLRYIEFGSAPMLDGDRATITKLLPGVPLYNFYGSTEAGRATVYNFNTPGYKERCIGRPTYNTSIFLVDDAGKEIKTSSCEQPGLLACRGDMCMKGYYKDEEETASVLHNGVVYSNDEAYVDEDGDIILLGRRGDVINIGGRKVSPEEIEDAAKRIEGIADCGCIAVSDSVAGHVPKLFVQMEEGASFSETALFEALRSVLEPFQVPKYAVAIDRIPRTYNGKLSRKDLEKLNKTMM